MLATTLKNKHYRNLLRDFNNLSQEIQILCGQLIEVIIVQCRLQLCILTK